MIDLKGIFKAKGKELIDSVGNTLDKVFTNKEELAAAKLELEKEVNRHVEALENSAVEVEKIYLADVDSARSANTHIQESDKASWMAKNIAYIIDIFIAFIWGAFTLYLAAIAAKLMDSNADMTGLLSIYSTVTAVFMITVNFHRGTSKGSDEKQKTIDRMLKRS